MHIEYKISQAGVGLYIFIDIETQIISNAEANDKNVPAFQIKFSDTIPDLLKVGVEYMDRTLDKHSDVIPSDGNSYILNVTAIETNPAHYQLELFIGATIMWLNNLFSLQIDLPTYHRNRDKGCFEFIG